MSIVHRDDSAAATRRVVSAITRGVPGDWMPRRASSAITSLRSAHASRLRSGSRSRYAGWNVGITLMPLRSWNLPRSALIGASVPSSVFAAGRPSATMMRGAIARDARLEERLAGRDLVGLRVAIARRPAAHDVVDVDGLPRPAHRLDHLVEQLAGGPDERLAALVLLLARRLADEHQRRVLGADAEHDRLARRVQLAARALAELGANLRERLRPSGIDRASAIASTARAVDHRPARAVRATRRRPRAARVVARQLAAQLRHELGKFVCRVHVEHAIRRVCHGLGGVATRSRSR